MMPFQERQRQRMFCKADTRPEIPRGFGSAGKRAYGWLYGDGINDAAAMKSADIGISVDTAVDVAKESADIILLEKNLMVLEQGIIEGAKPMRI